jgi:predicted HD superfamily hydrolase involved in NAD metabolism
LIGCDAEKKILSHIGVKRRVHSLRVAKLAALLAAKEGAGRRKAYVAGLLHDCAKNESVHAELKDIAKYKVRLTPFEKRSPELWHAKTGAKKAAVRLSVRDKDIIEAVSGHTTGSPVMGKITRALYIADFCEEGRKYHEAHYIRKMAIKGKGLSLAIKKVVREKLIYLMKSRIPVHENTILLLEKMEQK